jgi:hypothetical protein
LAQDKVNMFDFEDFVMCVECLLLGTEETRRLWTTTTTTNSSTTRTWRSTLPAATADTSALKSTMMEQGGSPSTYTAEFIDVIFRHTIDAGNQQTMRCPTLQIGVLFTSGTTDTTQSSYSSCYTLSLPLSKQDIALHYQSIGAELDGYNATELLNLAKMFVNALRGFQQQDVDTRDKVVLLYKDFDASLSLVLPTPCHQELSSEFITAALLGPIQSPSVSVKETNVSDEDIAEVRSLVHASKKTESQTHVDPVHSTAVPSTAARMADPTTGSADNAPPRAATVKAKPVARKAYKKQKVVLQNRRRANKLLPNH